MGKLFCTGRRLATCIVFIVAAMLQVAIAGTATTKDRVEGTTLLSDQEVIPQPQEIPGCTTVPLSFVSTPGTAIPDLGTITDTITVPDSAIITDINVDLGISHTFVGDLVITVEHNSTAVRIWDRDCNATQSINATADDEGTEDSCAVIAAGPIDSVSYPPVLATGEVLSAFDGLNTQGTWTLRIADTAALDTGTLNQWSLHFQVCPGAPAPVVSSYALALLAVTLLISGVIWAGAKNLQLRG